MQGNSKLERLETDELLRLKSDGSNSFEHTDIKVGYNRIGDGEEPLITNIHHSS